MLTATVEQRKSGASIVKLAGALDERSELPDLADKVGAGGKLLINLSGVESVSSIGVRDWIAWLASLDARGVRPALVQCSPPVVAQMNVVKDFASTAFVKSFQVPYRCEDCAKYVLQVINLSEMEGRPSKAPAQPCDACGKPMTFTEDASYFAFVPEQLKRARTSSAAIFDSQPEMAARGSSSEVNRGSSPGSSPDLARRVSQPRLPQRTSHPSLSAFQYSSSRGSQRTLPPPAEFKSGGNLVLIMIVIVLFAVVGVLLFMLAT